MRTLTSIPEHVRHEAYRTWRSQFRAIALVNVWRFAVLRSGAVLAVYGWIVAAGATPVVVAALLPGPSLWGGIVYALLYVLGATFVSVRILALVPAQPPSYRSWLFRALVVGGASILVAVAAVALGGLPDSVELALVATFTLPAVVIAFGIAISLASFLLSYGGQRVLRGKHPEALIVDALAGTLARLELRPEEWRVLGFKREVMFYLEVAATSLEFDLPRQLRTGDAATDAWLKQRAREWAYAVRERKKTVFTIDEAARSDLREAVALALGHVSLGDWEALERRKPPSIADLPREAKVRDALSTGMRAVVPGVLLIVLQQTSFALTGSASDYATIAVLAWAALTVLARFDPLFSEKIAALSNVKEFLKPPPMGGTRS